ncbi:MAG: NAD(P)/FAD-dependent oxidoreductase [Gemmiger sp.]|uniref:NAD(P)/FAD-dependent oxidoreductase n=1 Tax=Subdoligranulum variabile TaxID=214851 RepID=UPI0026EB534B|nr:NAD(P)/FAD-dependent oxidoreductase [Subdoligranulum variabile]
MTDLLILGGGAAGLMAAGAACARGLRVTVLEHNPKGPGQKLLITGKGRCNVTSDSDVREFLPFVRHNGRFLYSSLYAFPPSAAMELFESLGVPLKTERGRRVFPQSDRAADVLAALRTYAQDAEFVRGSAKKLLIEDGVCRGAVTDRGQTLRARATLVATGGISYPATGSDGSGYRLAEQAGHTIVPPQPSLCSLVSPDPACRKMMGLSLRNVKLTLLCDGKPLFVEQGEALFTHFGLSGPLVLSASTYIEDLTHHKYVCEFDLKPALDEKTLYERLTRDFAALGGHSAQGALEKLLPHSMRPVAVEKWGVDPATRAAQITREQKQALVQLCKRWQVPVTALGDREHAVVTAGGVDVREVDPKTMASKRCEGLYFAGEVLDVDARTGGYNLQIAWSTAQAAVRAIAEENA